MSLIKEISHHATIAWSPLGSQSSLLAIGSKEGVGLGFDNYGGQLQLYNLNFSDLSLNSSQLLGSIPTKSRFNTLVWNHLSQKYPQYEYGILAGGMSDSTITLYDPKGIVIGGADISEKPGTTPTTSTRGILGTIVKHKSSVLALQFNPHVENAHLLASGGADNEVYISTLDNLANPMIFTPYGKNTKYKPNDEITTIAWNTQVSYILATGSQNGTVTIWDLKQKQPWCELKEGNRNAISTILWNPNEGLHMITASSDKSILKLWDLRSSTSTPLAELNEHTEGILSAAWCPHDTGYLLSCGKDNRTLLWDLFQGQKIYEFPNDSINQNHQLQNHENSSMMMKQTDNTNFFSGASTGQRRFHVQWSPKVKSVASTCTFDGKIQVWNLASAMNSTTVNTKTGNVPPLRAPKWYKTPIKAELSFGGKLLVANNLIRSNAIGQQGQGQQGMDKKIGNKCGRVEIYQRSDNPMMIEKAVALDEIIKNQNYHEFCQSKINNSNDIKEKEIWTFLKILFEENPRQFLLEHLGYKPNEIYDKVNQFLENKQRVLKDTATAANNDSGIQAIDGTQVVRSGIDNPLSYAYNPEGNTDPSHNKSSFLIDNGDNSSQKAEDIFGKSTFSTNSFDNDGVLDEISDLDLSKGVNNVKQDSHISTDAVRGVGDVARKYSGSTASVSTPKPIDSISYGHLPFYTSESENLLKNLLLTGKFHETVECCLQNHQYTEALLLSTCGGEDLWKQTVDAFLQSQKERQVMKIIGAIINHDFVSYIRTSDVSQWKETLAMICSFASPEEFSTLCEALGQLLEDAKDHHNAVLCYLISLNSEKTVRLWKQAYQQTRIKDNKGGDSIDLLQDLIEKITVLVAANKAFTAEHSEKLLGEEIAEQYMQYAMRLVDEGRYDLAVKYAISNDKQCQVLKERLYYGDHTGYIRTIMNVPASPFTGEAISHTSQVSASSASIPSQAQQTGVNKVGTPYQQVPYMQQPQLSQAYGQPLPQAQAYVQPPVAQTYTQQPPAYGQQNSMPQAYGQPAQSHVPSQSYSQQPLQSLPAAGQTQMQGRPPAAGYSQPPMNSPAPTIPTKQPGFQQSSGLAEQPMHQNFRPNTSTPTHYPGASTGYYGASSTTVPGIDPSVGINSVAAAAASANKFAKPSADISKHQSDGFVSSVGNKELSLKYGNQTGYSMQPPEPVSNAPLQRPSGVGGASFADSSDMRRPSIPSTTLGGLPQQSFGPGMLGQVPVSQPVPPTPLTPQQRAMAAANVIPPTVALGGGVPAAVSQQPSLTTFVPTTHPTSATPPGAASAGTTATSTTTTVQKPEPVLGATDKVPSKDMPIVNTFNAIISALDQILPNLGAMDKKQLVEAKKAKELLFTKLNTTGGLSDNCIDNLHAMIKCFEARDWIAAHSIHVQLTTSEWNTNKEWLRGVKALIMLCKKCLQ